MKKLRSLAVIALLVPFLSPSTPSSAAYANVGVVTTDLLMYYDTANPSGLSGSTLTDLSGNGRSGTLTTVTNTPTYQSTNGTYLSFAGTDTTHGGYVDLPDLYTGSTWPGMTISFYANFGSNADSFERVMDFGTLGGGVDNIEVGRDWTTNALFVEVWSNTTSGGYCRSGSGANNTNVSGNSVIGVNTWNHWAITIGGGYCTVYKDNSQVNRVAYTVLPRGVNITSNFLGKSNWADVYFEGGIADFALYNRALNSTELTQNYNAQTDITKPTLSGGGVTANENQTSAATITTGEAGTTYSIIGGADSSKFSINSSSGALTFVTAPNYENPDDSGGNRVYDVTIRAVDINGNYTDYATTITLQNVIEGTSLTLPNLSSTPYKGITVTITVTPVGDGTSIPGKVTFKLAGKNIPGCIKKSFSGTGNSTCMWKPSVQGYKDISATFIPTDTNFTASSSKKTYWIYRRSTTR